MDRREQLPCGCFEGEECSECTVEREVYRELSRDYEASR